MIQEQVEEWRAIPDHDGYEVSSFGRVRSYRPHGGRRDGRLLVTPRLKATRRHNTGYLSVVLQRSHDRSQTYPVHVLVAAAFLGPRPAGYQVAHGDGDKLNARVDNLRYATPVDNALDKRLHGTAPRGEKNGNHKLDEARVAQILARYREGRFQKDIAREFGISQQQVSNIVRGAAWSHAREAI